MMTWEEFIISLARGDILYEDLHFSLVNKGLSAMNAEIHIDLLMKKGTIHGHHGCGGMIYS